MLTANPWLSVYIKVETSKWKELEKAVHNVIKLVAKTKQVKNSEFYLIEPEKAKKIMLELAPLFDKDDFAIYLDDGSTVNVPRKENDSSNERHSAKTTPAGFLSLGISPGDKLVFTPTGLHVVVVDDKTIGYKGKTTHCQVLPENSSPIGMHRRVSGAKIFLLPRQVVDRYSIKTQIAVWRRRTMERENSIGKANRTAWKGMKVRLAAFRISSTENSPAAKTANGGRCSNRQASSLMSGII